MSGTAADVSAPAIVSLTADRTSLNTTSAPDSVVYTAELTDAAGVLYIQMSIRSTTANATRYCYRGEPATGTAVSGSYRCVMHLGKFSPNGTWRLEYLNVYDSLNNYRWIYFDEAQALGWPVEITVTSDPDTVAPTITALTPDRSALNTVSAADSVVFTVAVTDNLAGTEWVSASYRSPSGNGYRYCSSYVLAGGTATNGSYQCVMQWPRYSEAGTWRLNYLGARDSAGNERYYNFEQAQANGLAPEIVVTSDPDTSGPVISSLTANRVDISTLTAGDSVVFTLTLSDQPAGFYYGYLHFWSPSRSSDRNCYMIRVEGTDNTYTCTMTWPALAEVGTWRYEVMYAYDVVYNGRYYYIEEAQANGWPTAIRVNANQPSLVAASLGQFQADSVTAIEVGGAAADSVVLFTASGSDADPEDAGLTLYVEAQPVGTPFTGTYTASQTFTSGGTGVVRVAQLERGDYRWRARVCDAAGGCTTWRPCTDVQPIRRHFSPRAFRL